MHNSPLSNEDEQYNAEWLRHRNLCNLYRDLNSERRGHEQQGQQEQEQLQQGQPMSPVLRSFLQPQGPNSSILVFDAAGFFLREEEFSLRNDAPAVAPAAEVAPVPRRPALPGIGDPPEEPAGASGDGSGSRSEMPGSGRSKNKKGRIVLPVTSDTQDSYVERVAREEEEREARERAQEQQQELEELQALALADHLHLQEMQEQDDVSVVGALVQETQRQGQGEVMDISDESQD